MKAEIPGSTTITGTFTQPQDGKTGFVTRPVAPDLADRLNATGVTYTGAVENTWFSTLLSWVLPALFFVLGLSTIFLLLGFAASAFGRFFLTNLEIFNRVAGAVVIVFGLHFLGVFRIRILDREARLDAGDRGGSALGAYVLGLAFAFGWTPCNGPILSGILTMAMQGNDMGRTLYLMAVYAMGLGLPFLLSAIFIAQAMGLMKRLKPHMRKIEIAMGLLLLIVGLTLFTGTFSVFSGWLLDWLTALGLPLLG